MKRRWGIPLLCAAVLAGLCGCASTGAHGRELEETVLVQVVGVDWDGRGVTLTAAGTDGEGETVLESVSGAGLAEAFAALPEAGETYFSLTNVTQILVGDGVNLREVLDYVLADREMSYLARVWAVNGFAGAVMGQTQDGGIARLALWKESGGTQTATVKSALAGLLDGGSTALTALTVRDGLLEPEGILYIAAASGIPSA